VQKGAGFQDQSLRLAKIIRHLFILLMESISARSFRKHALQLLVANEMQIARRDERIAFAMSLAILR
jgi:hypothetical protein